MISLEPTEEHALMRETAAQFAKTLRARVREFEKARALPDDVKRAAHEMGLTAAVLPEGIGGGGLGLVAGVLLEEEVAWGDPAAPLGFGGAGALGLAVAELGSPAHAKAALAPFVGADGWTRAGAVAWGERRAVPERAGLATLATKSGRGWRIDGEKAYVVNADRASRFVVFAHAGTGSGGLADTAAFLVDRDSAGLEVLAREPTLGLDAVSFGSIALRGVEVPDAARLENTNPGALVRFFAKQSLLVAARAVGLARAAFELARDYCDTRKAFGKPIGHFQAVAFNLADRAIDVEAARTLVWRAAWAWDSALPENDALKLTGQAVAVAHEAAMHAADDAVQLHGGAGFMRDYPVEKLMRDAKQLGLIGLTPAHADQLAAAIELGAPVDLARVLPTAESQSVFL
jgi:alkylation response protein AidB-like acyl-CoA dehydrogenase